LDIGYEIFSKTVVDDKFSKSQNEDGITPFFEVGLSKES
jgi:hypothetical protein